MFHVLETESKRDHWVSRLHKLSNQVGMTDGHVITCYSYFMCIGVLPACMTVQYVHVVPTEARRGH